MTVSNGQLANQTTFNNAFVSRTADDNTTGIKSLENTDTASGAFATNVQRDINSLSSFSGRSANSAKDALPSWANNDVGASTDDLKDRADSLTEKFNLSTGHGHDGTAGNGAQISASNLTELNFYRADWQTFIKLSASGNSTDVTSELSGKSPGGASAVAGVITTGSNNRVVIVNNDTETAIEDAGGQRVYGRITESTGTWTLSFYTNESGIETAHSLSSQDVRIYFKEVFTLETIPTIGADVGQIPSLDLTADIVDATSSQRGLTRFEAGEQAVSNGSSTVSVTFSNAFPNTSYAIAVSFRNVTDSNPIVFGYNITAKSTTGFTVTMNAAADSANYVLEYTSTRY